MQKNNPGNTTAEQQARRARSKARQARRKKVREAKLQRKLRPLLTELIQLRRITGRLNEPGTENNTGAVSND